MFDAIRRLKNKIMLDHQRKLLQANVNKIKQACEMKYGRTLAELSKEFLEKHPLSQGMPGEKEITSLIQRLKDGKPTNDRTADIDDAIRLNNLLELNNEDSLKNINLIKAINQQLSHFQINDLHMQHMKKTTLDKIKEYFTKNEETILISQTVLPAPKKGYAAEFQTFKRILSNFDATAIKNVITKLENQNKDNKLQLDPSEMQTKKQMLLRGLAIHLKNHLQANTTKHNTTEIKMLDQIIGNQQLEQACKEEKDCLQYAKDFIQHATPQDLKTIGIEIDKPIWHAMQQNKEEKPKLNG